MYSRKIYLTYYDFKNCEYVHLKKKPCEESIHIGFSTFQLLRHLSMVGLSFRNRQDMQSMRQT